LGTPEEEGDFGGHVSPYDFGGQRLLLVIEAHSERERLFEELAFRLLAVQPLVAIDEDLPPCVQYAPTPCLHHLDR